MSWFCVYGTHWNCRAVWSKAAHNVVNAPQLFANKHIHVPNACLIEATEDNDDAHRVLVLVLLFVEVESLENDDEYVVDLRLVVDKRLELRCLVEEVLLGTLDVVIGDETLKLEDDTLSVEGVVLAEDVWEAELDFRLLLVVARGLAVEECLDVAHDDSKEPFLRVDVDDVRVVLGDIVDTEVAFPDLDVVCGWEVCGRWLAIAKEVDVVSSCWKLEDMTETSRKSEYCSSTEDSNVSEYTIEDESYHIPEDSVTSDDCTGCKELDITEVSAIFDDWEVTDEYNALECCGIAEDCSTSEEWTWAVDWAWEESGW